MTDRVRLMQHIGKTVTLKLPDTSISGTLREVTQDFVVLETGADGDAEIVYVCFPSILAIIVRGKAES